MTLITNYGYFSNKELRLLPSLKSSGKFIFYKTRYKVKMNTL